MARRKFNPDEEAVSALASRVRDSARTMSSFFFFSSFFFSSFFFFFSFFFFHGALRPQKPQGLLGTDEGGGEREIIYLSLHCHHQNDFCINNMCGGESHFNVS